VAEIIKFSFYNTFRFISDFDVVVLTDVAFGLVNLVNDTYMFTLNTTEASGVEDGCFSFSKA